MAATGIEWMDRAGFVGLDHFAEGRVVMHARFIETGEAPFVPSWASDFDPTARA